jgi:cytochrome c oxidase subunit 4
MQRPIAMSASEHEHGHEHIRKHIRVYLWVFAALTVGTIITVAIANVHMGILLGIIVAVIVATAKGSLVAGYFMHLFAEKTMIYWLLALTAVCALAMVLLIMFTHVDQQGEHEGPFPSPRRMVQPKQTHAP